jgi:hypothetical protein
VKADTAWPQMIRLGIARGAIELRQTFTYWPDVVQWLFFSAVSVGVLFLMRGHHVPGTDFSLGSLTVPSMAGMNVAFSGLLGVTGLLSVEREDGTLLRAKATPGGMAAYVIGKIMVVSVMTLTSLVVLLIIGQLVFPGLTVTGTGWATLAWVVAGGLLATVPPRHHGRLTDPQPAVRGDDDAAVRRDHRHIRDLLSDHPPAGVAAGDRAGLPDVLDRARDAFGAAAAVDGGGGDRRVLAALAGAARAVRVGGRGPGGGAAGAAADGAARIRITGGGPARARAAADDVRGWAP